MQQRLMKETNSKDEQGTVIHWLSHSPHSRTYREQLKTSRTRLKSRQSCYIHVTDWPWIESALGAGRSAGILGVVIVHVTSRSHVVAAARALGAAGAGGDV